MCNKKYMVVDTVRTGSGDGFVEFYDSLKAANDAAAVEWERLDRWQKKRSHIFVAWVTRDDIDDMLIDDDFNNDEWWKYTNSCQSDKYCFDSEKGSKTMVEEFNRLASLLYDFIYEEEENSQEIEEIADGYMYEFDDLMRQEEAKEFMTQATRARGDFYSSDREAAAAAMAYRLLIARD